MTLPISAFLALLTCVLLVPVVVFALEIIVAVLPWRPSPPPSTRRTRIAVLVPAHNEASGILTTLAALRPSVNAEDLLVVVADNCSDATAQMARDAGATVIERNDATRRGKGYALDHGVRWLEQSAPGGPPPVVIIVDADCIVHPGAVDRIATRCAETARPIQATYLMQAPRPARPMQAIAEFAWTVKNLVRPLGAHRLGQPCHLTGSGMAFPWDALRSAPLASGHIVEDMKMGIDLALAGMPPMFCREALVSSHFAENTEGATNQRKRWEHGHLGIILHDTGPLLRGAIKQRRLGLAAMALDIAVPPLALLAMMAAALFAVCALFALATGQVLPLILSTTALLLMATGVGLAWWSYGRESVSFGTLLSAAFYAARKLPLYLGFLKRPETTWIRSRRDGQEPPLQPSEPVRAAAATDFSRPIQCVIGMPLDAVDTAGALARIRHSVSTRERCWLSTPNVQFLTSARRDPDFRDCLLQGDLNVIDGMPLFWMARLMGLPFPQRVAGSDLFAALMRGEGGPVKVFFFGGPDGAGARAAARINAIPGPVSCVGYASPGFGSVEEMSTPAILESIRKAAPDFVIVALGSQKGQAWIRRNRLEFEAPVIAHLGAVVNFAAGTVARAPVWMQRAGLEWLWRIKEEPALWQRYAKDAFRLAALGINHVLPVLVGRWRKHGEAPVASASLQIGASGTATRLDLRGTWRAKDGPQLARTLAEAVRPGEDIELQLMYATAMDPHIVGQLLLLRGHQCKLGRALRLLGAASPLRKQLRRQGADFLLDAST